jgi:sulfonate transport system substrate-binding protein
MSSTSARRRRHAYLRGLLAACIVAVGVPVAVAVASTGKTAAATPIKYTIRVGILAETAPVGGSLAGPAPGSEAYYQSVGKLSSALAKEGIAISSVSGFGSGPLLLAALEGGSIDVALGVGDTPILNAAGNGVGLKIINVEQAGIDAWLVAKKGGPTSISQLKGATVGEAKGTYEDKYLTGLIYEHHLTEDQVTIENIASPATLASALENGSIDFAITGQAAAPSFVAETGGTVINRASVSEPQLTATSFTIESSSYAAANPGFAKAINTVHGLAAAAVNKDPAGFYAWDAKQQNLPVADVKETTDATTDYPTQALPKVIWTKLQSTLTFLENFGYLPKGALALKSLLAPGVAVGK